MWIRNEKKHVTKLNKNEYTFVSEALEVVDDVRHQQTIFSSRRIFSSHVWVFKIQVLIVSISVVWGQNFCFVVHF